VSAERPAVDYDLDRVKRDLWSAKELNDGFFVEFKIEAGAHIAEHREQKEFQIGSRSFLSVPFGLVDLKARAVGFCERGVDELMLDGFGTKVDELAVATSVSRR